MPTPLNATSYYAAPITGDDRNPGTASSPVQTMDRLNDLLFEGELVGDTVIRFLEDDASLQALDLSTIIQGPFNLNVKGTRQVTHSGGVLGLGTVTMNPAATGGGQRQLARASDLPDFAAYVTTDLGGTSPYAQRLVDTVTNGGSWIIAAGTGGVSFLARPIDYDSNLTTIGLGDSYMIERGSLLTLASTPTPSTSSGILTFTDLEFTAASGAPAPTATSNFPYYQRCAFRGQLVASGFLTDCFLRQDMLVVSGQVDFFGGVLNTNQGRAPSVALTADVYVTGTGITVHPEGYAAVSVFASNGAGVQIHDCTNKAAIQFTSSCVGGVLDGFSGLQSGLIWGNGNKHTGLLVWPGATVSVSSLSGYVPSITGQDGDFGFLTSGGTVIRVARASVDGQWTEAGAAAVRVTSWPNLQAAVAAGGFNFAAFVPELQAALIAI